MMRKNMTIEPINDIMDSITKSERVGNHHKCMFMPLFLLIAMALFSLPVSTIMANAQPYPNSTSGSHPVGNTTGTSNATISTGNNTQVTQMGICVVGVKSPCNGDSI
jgi:hypothetical protein